MGWFSNKGEIEMLRAEVSALRQELSNMRMATVIQEDRAPHPLFADMYGYRGEVAINSVVRMMLDHLGLKVTKKRAHESVVLEPLDKPVK